MSDKKYVSLDFGHGEINKLLKKINDGMVLSKEQYQKLINEIGLDKISTFDGDYNKLNNLPQIPTKVSELELDIEIKQEEGGGITEENVNALIQNAIENKADKEQLEDMNNNIADLLALKLDVKEGEKITFDKVLLIGGESSKVGTPYVANATVTAKVEKQGKAKKIIVFKYKNKTTYRKTQGHRQPYTRVTIESINA